MYKKACLIVILIFWPFVAYLTWLICITGKQCRVQVNYNYTKLMFFVSTCSPDHYRSEKKNTYMNHINRLHWVRQCLHGSRLQGVGPIRVWVAMHVHPNYTWAVVTINVGLTQTYLSQLVSHCHLILHHACMDIKELLICEDMFYNYNNWFVSKSLVLIDMCIVCFEMELFCNWWCIKNPLLWLLLVV